MRKFNTGATRDTDEGKFDFEGFLCPLALERYAAYMHTHRKQANGEMRASDNWQKGLPIKECVKSLFRHFVDLWKLNRDYAAVDQKDGHFVSMEEACCAMIFNNFSILSTLQKLKQRAIKLFADPKDDCPPECDPQAWEETKDGDCVQCDPLGTPYKYRWIDRKTSIISGELPPDILTPEQVKKEEEALWGTKSDEPADSKNNSSLSRDLSDPPLQYGGDQ